VGLTDNKTTGLKGSGPDQNVSVVNASVGGGQSHSNIPPVLACYYIMYIP
jgi:microcystin-dependent protein